MVVWKMCDMRMWRAMRRCCWHNDGNPSWSHGADKLLSPCARLVAWGRILPEDKTVRQGTDLVNSPLRVEHGWGAEGEPHLRRPLISLQIYAKGRSCRFPNVLVHLVLILIRLSPSDIAPPFVADFM